MAQRPNWRNNRNSPPRRNSRPRSTSTSRTARNAPNRPNRRPIQRPSTPPRRPQRPTNSRPNVRGPVRSSSRGRPTRPMAPRNTLPMRQDNLMPRPQIRARPQGFPPQYQNFGPRQQFMRRQQFPQQFPMGVPQRTFPPQFQSFGPRQQQFMPQFPMGGRFPQRRPFPMGPMRVPRSPQFPMGNSRMNFPSRHPQRPYSFRGTQPRMVDPRVTANQQALRRFQMSQMQRLRESHRQRMGMIRKYASPYSRSRYGPGGAPRGFKGGNSRYRPGRSPGRSGSGSGFRPNYVYKAPNMGFGSGSRFYDRRASKGGYPLPMSSSGSRFARSPQETRSDGHRQQQREMVGQYQSQIDNMKAQRDATRDPFIRRRWEREIEKLEFKKGRLEKDMQSSQISRPKIDSQHAKDMNSLIHESYGDRQKIEDRLNTIDRDIQEARNSLGRTQNTRAEHIVNNRLTQLEAEKKKLEEQFRPYRETDQRYTRVGEFRDEGMHNRVVTHKDKDDNMVVTFRGSKSAFDSPTDAGRFAGKPDLVENPAYGPGRWNQKILDKPDQFFAQNEKQIRDQILSGHSITCNGHSQGAANAAAFCSRVNTYARELERDPRYSAQVRRIKAENPNWPVVNINQVNGPGIGDDTASNHVNRMADENTHYRTEGYTRDMDPQIGINGHSVYLEDPRNLPGQPAGTGWGWLSGATLFDEHRMKNVGPAMEEYYN